ncbi:hypothetical protein H7347_05645 [Corynebacterium sp. zg-331]|uniref:hypothetical protein n=1 Tax=unclassified Corynebacterium TaxID=2624378 RepID=UPI00128CFAF7|nr:MULTISPECIES: hypothetical protein [unclassified Corynebacterium]MBC3186062.1 hypothetical protein [Corynebacterium sp. zg-331]MPV52552.1 hypothetical protein [Corynebacterium sp. zg331]
MRNYTLRLITAPVQHDAWEAHYSFLDDIPGASLVENPASPEIIFDIDAQDPTKANLFALGLANLLDLTITGISMLDERPSSPDARQVPALERVHEWAGQAPQKTTLAP